MLGAGSVVVENIPDLVMAFGNPAKVKKYLKLNTNSSIN